MGFRVVTARNGREALFIAREEKPDLIVLDLMMPEMDGKEFMTLHRRQVNTPIIMLTAKVDESDRIVGLELGADDYVTKPFKPRVSWLRGSRLCCGGSTMLHPPATCSDQGR